jgi:hypothetical protein
MKSLVTLNLDRSSVPVLDAWGDGLCRLGDGFICWPLRRSHDHPADEELVGALSWEIHTGLDHHPSDGQRPWVAIASSSLLMRFEMAEVMRPPH